MECAREGHGGILVGEKVRMGSPGGLDDEMIGENAAKWAEKLSTDLKEKLHGI